MTGPLWGRKAWGVWWQWDARLTSSLLLELMMIAYLLARRYAGPAGRKLSAALALFAAIDVPLVYKSVDIWRTVHPQTTVVPTLDPRMRPAFWSAFALILVVWSLLLALRMRLERAARRAGRAAPRRREISGGPLMNTARSAPASLRRGALAVVVALWAAAASAQEFQKVEGPLRQELPAGPFVRHRLRVHLDRDPGLRPLRGPRPRARPPRRRGAARQVRKIDGAADGRDRARDPRAGDRPRRRPRTSSSSR